MTEDRANKALGVAAVLLLWVAFVIAGCAGYQTCTVDGKPGICTTQGW